LLLVDNAAYVLGIPKGEAEKDAARARACQTAFRELVADCAQRSGDNAVAAVLRFLDGPGAAQLSLGEDFDASANLSFRVEGELPFERRAVQRYWAEINEPQENVMQCLVCGETRPALERLKGVIKGIPGGQASGTSIISANASAFESYGLEASLISPICGECAERSYLALNHLLRDEHQRLIIGSSAFVYWTREDSEFSFATFLSQPDPEDVRRLLLSAYGKTAAPVQTNRFYAAILGASGGRVQVRAWLDTPIDEAQRNLARWFQRQRIVGPWGEEPRPLGVRSLAAATVRDLRDLPPHTVQNLLLAAVGGRPIAPALMQQAAQRTRAEQTVQHHHAALIKLAYCTQYPDQEETMTQLDLSNRAPAYLCGRLLAELEQAQRTASPGVKASIVDRYYGTACTAPATVFGTLLQNAQAHLAKLERDRRGAYIAIQATLEDILAALDAFPSTLSLNEQSLFALGYYHQRATNRAQAIAHKKEDPS
jgi:CRISPR-associated protein Csd1